MLRINFLESRRCVETFCNLGKPLSIHTFFVVLSQHSHRGLHLLVHLLLARMELPRVNHDFILLVCHLPLELAYLALEHLHFLRPGESLSFGSR